RRDRAGAPDRHGAGVDRRSVAHRRDVHDHRPLHAVAAREYPQVPRPATGASLHAAGSGEPRPRGQAGAKLVRAAVMTRSTMRVAVPPRSARGLVSRSLLEDVTRGALEAPRMEGPPH